MLNQLPKTFSGRASGQNDWEFGELLAFMRRMQCRSYLEIGARHGDTFYDVVTQLPIQSTACAIDLPDARWGHPDSEANLYRTVKELSKLRHDVHMFIGDSRSPEAFAFAKRHGPFDMILIDGDHTYAGVTSDFLTYAPLGKYVAFHDIAGAGISHRHGNSSYNIDVPRLWNEVKIVFDNWEYVAQGSRMGIGILETGSRQ